MCFYKLFYKTKSAVFLCYCVLLSLAAVYRAKNQVTNGKIRDCREPYLKA